MPLSVAYSAGGGGLSNLLRQTRPAQPGDEASSSASTEASAAASARPLGRAAIDSTGSRTAAIKAALLAQTPPVGAGDAADKIPTRAAAVPAPARTGAADILRVLDSYAADPLRLSA